MDIQDALGCLLREDFEKLVISWPYMDWPESRMREAAVRFARLVPVAVHDPKQMIREHEAWEEEGVTILASEPEPTAEELIQLPPASGSESWRRNLVGDSASMGKIVEMIRIIANRRSTVLILGETGTGKEAVARAIHEASNRKGKDLVTVNCAAIPESLIEAELFGHAKGAYTGAATARAGYFERANGGTILLDEIGEMPLSLQGKLLRVLQEREVQRIGAADPVSVDCRVIAASNIDLAEEALQKRFRPDLFYRLSVVVLRLPPLRERKEDIPALVDHFIQKICALEGLPPCRVSTEALMRLADYDWPGNVRELEHRVESALVLANGRRVLTAQDFPVPVSRTHSSSHRAPAAFPDLPSCGLDMEETVRQLEMHLLASALERANGNKARAANLLGLKRTTLLYKARTLGFALS